MGGYEEPTLHVIREVEEGTPTQVAHPWRSILRTIVVALVGFVLAQVIRYTGLDLTAWSAEIVDQVTNGIWLVLTGVFQYVITRPGVENFLIKFLPPLATGVHTERLPKAA